MDNIKLVEHCKIAEKEKWGYVYGTFGTVLTEPLLQQKLKQYPSKVKIYESFIRENWMNKRIVDCVGLIKSFLWWNDGNIKYNLSEDKSANGTYNLAKEKGPIPTIPEMPGICVWKDGHIGVYIGNGKVIEARGTKQGVIQSPLKGNSSVRWTHWFKYPYIHYISSRETIEVNINGRKLNLEGYLEDGINYIKLNGSVYRSELTENY